MYQAIKIQQRRARNRTAHSCLPQSKFHQAAAIKIQQRRARNRAVRFGGWRTPPFARSSKSDAEAEDLTVIALGRGQRRKTGNTRYQGLDWEGHQIAFLAYRRLKKSSVHHPGVTVTDTESVQFGGWCHTSPEHSIKMTICAFDYHSESLRAAQLFARLIAIETLCALNWTGLSAPYARFIAIETLCAYARLLKFSACLTAAQTPTLLLVSALNPGSIYRPPSPVLHRPADKFQVQPAIPLAAFYPLLRCSNIQDRLNPLQASDPGGFSIYGIIKYRDQVFGFCVLRFAFGIPYRWCTQLNRDVGGWVSDVGP
ncbi:hypothetical protein B0H10DRAFT_1959072 [Mycena sp. CBHHK59/15]|nr:hypothetical protein B0H10DRAFT_1959072 [Mycena sp. CBHHK59/15]